jgi:hypothetical protein
MAEIDMINMIANNIKSNLDKARSKNESDIEFVINNKIIRVFKDMYNKNTYHITDDNTFFETGTLLEIAEVIKNIR